MFLERDHAIDLNLLPSSVTRNVNGRGFSETSVAMSKTGMSDMFKKVCKMRQMCNCSKK